MYKNEQEIQREFSGEAIPFVRYSVNRKMFIAGSCN